jgi:hypothetical protein
VHISKEVKPFSVTPVMNAFTMQSREELHENNRQVDA